MTQPSSSHVRGSAGCSCWQGRTGLAVHDTLPAHAGKGGGEAQLPTGSREHSWGSGEKSCLPIRVSSSSGDGAKQSFTATPTMLGGG